MSNAAMWTALIGGACALLLASRSFRSQNLSGSSTLKMALIWAALIVGLTLLIRQFAG